MYLLTKSETLKTGATATFTSATNTSNIIDGDRTTSAETADRDPNLSIDLGARKVINALWLKGSTSMTTPLLRQTTIPPTLKLRLASRCHRMVIVS